MKRVVVEAHESLSSSSSPSSFGFGPIYYYLVKKDGKRKIKPVILEVFPI
jgi:hypothetical protein